MRKLLIAPVTAGVLLALAGPALAATKTTTFQVSATVLKNCVISAANLALGEFDGANNLDSASSDITVRCTNDVAYSVALSQGSSGSYVDRTLIGPSSDALVYNLFNDATRSTIWDDSAGVVNGTGGGMSAPRTHTVYGQLLASKNTGPVQAGSYTDTITATITY